MRIGFGVDSTIFVIRNPQKPILIIEALTLHVRRGFFSEAAGVDGTEASTKWRIASKPLLKASWDFVT